MAKPNYKFAKRQKEMAKQKKKKEKEQRKLARKDGFAPDENPEEGEADPEQRSEGE